MSKLQVHNDEVSKILVEAKLLPKDVVDRTIKDFPDEWLEDSLVMSQKVSEADLLKTLAAKYKTRFLSVEKLKIAELPHSTLAAIPKKMAETLNVFPITFDSKTGQLGYLTADPSDKALAEQVRLASGLQDIRPFLARPSAIRAAIAKNYSGNLQAFASFDNFAQRQIQQIMKVYEERDEGASVMPPAMGNGGGRDVFETAGESFVEHRERGTRKSMMPIKGATMAPPAKAPEPIDPWIPTIELCNVLVSLLEQGRGELRGHSSFVARLMRRMTEKMKLDIDQTAACVLAAHLHDIGKMGSFHLTAFNASEFS
ncbi:MAG: hypothetical protein KBF88_00685 [Polyangiaceae bacterium]|nr:hypothetical protein [Polyangiaceae bacterium]